MLGEKPPPVDVLIAIVSRWPDFLRWSHTILVAAELIQSPHLPRCQEKGWRSGLRSTAFVITDSVTAHLLPAGCSARVFRVVSDFHLPSCELTSKHSSSEYANLPLRNPAGDRRYSSPHLSRSQDMTVFNCPNAATAARSKSTIEIAKNPRVMGIKNPAGHGDSISMLARSPAIQPFSLFFFYSPAAGGAAPTFRAGNDLQNVVELRATLDAGTEIKHSLSVPMAKLSRPSSIVRYSFGTLPTQNDWELLLALKSRRNYIGALIAVDCYPPAGERPRPCGSQDRRRQNYARSISNRCA